MNAADMPLTCSDLPASQRCEASLPDNPQCAPNYHFGMLLGVEDFRAEQGFHTGRLRRHQRLLHGAGVVAGFPVEYDAEQSELRVGAGYGIDALGRDLMLESARCVNLALWWKKHRKETDFADVKPATPFFLDVIVCYANCLDRPVPAIAEPCAGDAADIAHSRICETVKLGLVRHRDEAVAPKPGDYHLLRMWLGLDEAARDAEGKLLPDDQWLADAFAQLQALPVDQQGAARQALLRELLARAVAAVAPFAADTGADEAATCLVLARLTVKTVARNGDTELAVLKQEIGVRKALLPTSLLQALLLAEPPPAPVAAGPVVAHDGASQTGKFVKLIFNQPLAAASLTKDAFAVSEFDETSGWKGFSIDDIKQDTSDPLRPAVTLQLDRTPAGKRLRVTVIGAGNTPLLGANLIPAGAPYPDSDGRNFTITLTL